MKTLIISTSLNPSSRSRLMARHLEAAWEKEDREIEWVDLRDYELPLCDGGAAYSHPNVEKLADKFAQADGFVFAVPIYNFDINAAAKNLIEMMGSKLEGKLAGFLCAAGGHSSYMSVMAVANSLMLDFRTVILPRFVYGARGDFEGDQIVAGIRERIDLFGREFQELGLALQHVKQG